MCELKFKQPCNDCPWRRRAIPGWLGSSTPEAFMATTFGEEEMPCHQTIDYTDPDWLTTQMGDAAHCAGSLIFFRNHFKMPRDPKLAEAVNGVERDVKVFSRPEEFVAYHGTECHMQQFSDPRTGKLSYDIYKYKFVLKVYQDDELTETLIFSSGEEWTREGWRFDALGTIGVFA